MPGMGGAPQNGNSVIVSAFHTELFHQLLAVLLIGAVCAIAFNVIRTLQYRQLRAQGGPTRAVRADATPEPVARRVLRIGFGGLWILDGLLQLQSAMPLGLPPNVIQPSAATSPQWVQHVVNSGVSIWSNHPIQAASSAVWIQLGLGLWLLVAPRGRWSRLGGAASAGWGLVVWVFGEAFGGIFAPGATWLFGTPGAVLFYCVAGLLVALPERAFITPRVGRLILALGGAFLIGMAVLQAWPGRGFWQGRGGTLPSMVAEMSRTSQPGFLSSWVASFGRFDDAHGWAVNLFAVVALGAIGGLLISGRRRAVLGGVGALVVLCLADWVLVEDLGFLGGLGTDPNSMVPMALLFVAGYLAEFRVPVEAGALHGAKDEAAANAYALASTPGPRSGAAWLWHATPAYVMRSIAALAALAVVVIGAAPMATAAVDQRTDPILSVALDGTPNSLDSPAPPFALTDQNGRPVSLESLRGHTVALTFLDPVCTTDCPLIAQEFRQADQQLSSQRARVDFVAIVANPIFRSAAFTNAFDRQEGLTNLANWYFLTGSLPALQHVWDSYGVLVSTLTAGAMVAHSDLAFVIDAQGRERDALIDDPGPTQSYASSFSSLLLSRIDDVVHS
jgi:cytochrome oxidase Cu insertion factor (SCO1/SenC/PrrC family)